MPRRVKDLELEQLSSLLVTRPAGWRIGEIEQACAAAGVILDRRTLQRRLARLKSEHRIEVVGAGRATLYKPVVPEGAAATESGIPLSRDAQEIRALVARPLSARNPVGYRRQFLDDYRPGETWYLSAQMRQHLMDIGRRVGADHAAGTYARQILDRLLIDLSWASSRLEGNTYSLLETERLVALGEAAPGKTPFETQMVLNHKAAIEFLVDAANEIGFDRRTILNLHALLSDNLLGNPAASGYLRAIPVSIGKSVYEPLAIPQLIDEIFRQILDTVAAIPDPFEQAFFVTAHLPYLQPFEDVNKRVSRLAANIPLIRNNLCPLSFVDVPEDLYIQGLLGIYELNRIELLRDVFVWTYERSCERYRVVRHTLGEPDPFRLRYRQALIDSVSEAVRQIARGDTDDSEAVIARLAKELVPADDRHRFLEVARQEIGALHEGNFARYRLRSSEFSAWQKATGRG